ncbi:LAGLIDADG family homing endonuclease [Rossellomorea aquimaris]|uniref:LAGLIDADG family homing endonuclease n=1 Tax=Rossellomorea aquimaris TaxID=189382 RepID=UPI001CD30D84|nr:LAGLIDADG family homing endonuclease [Rossellomorea aquimaris]MCA1061284.1 LAGLIDADG family homing endonuclease [Rossellomorea aquimaris]
MEDWEAAYLAGIIDGEGSITLTRMHDKEHRRPCITVASTDYELLEYLQILTSGQITKKKNYHPDRHLDSYTLSVKAKNQVLYILKLVFPFLRVQKKKKRASWILDHYDRVTVRNGKYTPGNLKQKVTFEEEFFKL